MEAEGARKMRDGSRPSPSQLPEACHAFGGAICKEPAKGQNGSESGEAPAWRGGSEPQPPRLSPPSDQTPVARPWPELLAGEGDLLGGEHTQPLPLAADYLLKYNIRKSFCWAK